MWWEGCGVYEHGMAFGGVILFFLPFLYKDVRG